MFTLEHVVGDRRIWVNSKTEGRSPTSVITYRAEDWPALTHEVCRHGPTPSAPSCGPWQSSLYLARVDAQSMRDAMKE